jgi:anti-anti-sigma factor
MNTHAENRVFAIDQYEKTIVVCPQGDATGFRYNDIHRDTNALCDLIDRKDIENLVIDFSQVNILGSIIISSIIKLARKISTKEGKACFCQASDSMRDVVTSMNLTRLWPYFDTLNDAIAHLDE